MNVLPVVAGIMFSLFGGYMLRQATTNYKKALESKNWPTVTGNIVELHLWGKRNIDGQMQDAEKLSVTYQYSVNDNSYTGHAVSFYTLHYPETLQFARQYADSRAVTVYYRPHDAAVSVLIPGPRPGKPYSDMIMGSLALVVGAVVAIAGATGVLG